MRYGSYYFDNLKCSAVVLLFIEHGFHIPAVELF